MLNLSIASVRRETRRLKYFRVEETQETATAALSQQFGRQ